MFNISLEAMQAVLQSRLGRELDALWQEVIDYRDKSLSDMSYNGKLSAIKKFFKNTTCPKFFNVVWKYVGIQFVEIQFTSIMNSSFCTWMFFDKDGKMSQTGTSQIENIITGEYIKRAFPEVETAVNEDHFTAEDLLRIASSYNKNGGIIKESYKLQIRKIIKPILGFDIEFAFMLKDQLAANSGIDNFTAREITAIVLHEIGHTISMIEHSADCYARMTSFNYLSEAFKKSNADKPDQAIRLAEAVAAKIKKSDPTNSDRLSKMAAKFRADVAKAGGSALKNKQRDAVRGLSVCGMVFLIAFFDQILDVVFGSVQGTRFASDQKHKISDLPLNRRLVTWEERKADEYAFTHGYGVDQASALNKMDKYYARLGMSDKDVVTINEAENLHKGLGLFAKLGILYSAPVYSNSAGYSLYPEGSKRFRELINLTIQQLKQHCSDPDYVTKYMKDAEAILNIVDNPSSRDEYIAKVYRGYDIFLKYCSIPSFIDWIVDGRVQRELEEVLESANAIGNNLLTYYGLKIQQISK